MPAARRQRPILSAEHLVLGAALRAVREAAGVSTRSMGYSSGHISNVENGLAVPSLDLVHIYVKLGGDARDLTRLLESAQSASDRAKVDRRRAGRDPSMLVEPPSDVALIDSPDEVRRHYAIEYYDVVFTLNNFGAITEIGSLVKIRALVPGVRFYYTGHSIDANRGREQLKFQAQTGGRLARIDESVTGALNVYFELDERISPSDVAPHVLAYSVKVDQDGRLDPSIAYYARPGSRRHSLTVQFEEPAVPDSIWKFEASDAISSLHPRTDDFVEPAGANQYRCTFESLRAGWSYGMAWIWRDEPSGRLLGDRTV